MLPTPKASFKIQCFTTPMTSGVGPSGLRHRMSVGKWMYHRAMVNDTKAQLDMMRHFSAAVTGWRWKLVAEHQSLVP